MYFDRLLGVLVGLISTCSRSWSLGLRAIETFFMHLSIKQRKIIFNDFFSCDLPILLIHTQFYKKIEIVMSFILEKNSKGTLTTFTCIGNQAKTHLEKYKSKCFHNAKNLTYFENKSLVYQTISFFASCIAIILTFAYVETQIYPPNQLIKIGDYLLLSCLVSAMFYGFSCFQDINVQLLNEGKLENTFKNSHQKIFKAIISSLVLAIHPNYIFFQEDNQSPSKKIVIETLTLISYGKIFYIYFYIAKMSRYYGSRPARLLSIYGHRKSATNLKYAIKCHFKEKGFISNIFLFVFAVGFLGMVITVFQDDEFTYFDGMYEALITMTSVGYGDMSPGNHLSKMLIIIVIITGSFASSVSTLFFLQSFELSSEQWKSYRIIKRLKTKEEITMTKLKIVQALSNKRSIERAKQTIKEIKKKGQHWEDKQKQCRKDKEPVHELIYHQYNYFLSRLKIFIENQVLCDNLLAFYLKSVENYEKNNERISHNKLSAKSLKSHRSYKKRVEDNSYLYKLKLRILQQ